MPEEDESDSEDQEVGFMDIDGMNSRLTPSDSE